MTTKFRPGRDHDDVTDLDMAECRFDYVHDEMFRYACALAHAKNERGRKAAKKKLTELGQLSVERAEHFADSLRERTKRMTTAEHDAVSKLSAAREEKRNSDRRIALHALGFREGYASARDGIASWLHRLRKGGLGIRVEAEEFRQIAGQPKPERIDP